MCFHVSYWNYEGVNTHVGDSFGVVRWKDESGENCRELSVNCRVSYPPFDGSVVWCVDYELVCDGIERGRGLETLNI